MTTKNNPGPYDCYGKAHPDEPMFVLLGRDPQAGLLVRTWIAIRRRRGESAEVLAEAEQCANAMDAWAKKIDRAIESEPVNEDGIPLWRFHP